MRDAHRYARLVVLEAEALATDHRVGVDGGAITDPAAAPDDGRSADRDLRADDNIRPNHGVRPDRHVDVDRGRGVDDGGGMDTSFRWLGEEQVERAREVEPGAFRYQDGQAGRANQSGAGDRDQRAAGCGREHRLGKVDPFGREEDERAGARTGGGSRPGDREVWPAVLQAEGVSDLTRRRRVRRHSSHSVGVANHGRLSGVNGVEISPQVGGIEFGSGTESS